MQLVDKGFGVDVKRVRSFSLPIPEGGELADAQIEGMVADRELGYLYLAQENVGIWKFAAEAQGDNKGILIDAVKPQGANLSADAEGLTIYYAGDNQGYLLASSQGDSTFAVYDKQGDNKYLGNFVIDGVQASDGADIVNVPLGAKFPLRLLVVHDGSNSPAVVVNDDGVLENASTNFKFVPWQNVANAFEQRLPISSTGYNPRQSLFGAMNGSDSLIGDWGSDSINDD